MVHAFTRATTHRRVKALLSARMSVRLPTSLAKLAVGAAFMRTT